MIDNNYPRIPLLNDNKQIKLYNEVLIKIIKYVKRKWRDTGQRGDADTITNERSAVVCAGNIRVTMVRTQSGIDTAYVQEDIRKRLRTHILWCRASDRKHGMHYWLNEGCCRSFEVELQPICERARTGIFHQKAIIMLSCLSNNRMSGGH
jgi:hypothetical protein